MRKLYYLLILFFSFSVLSAQEKLSKEEKARREKNIQAGNPFKQFGYKARIATLSKGKYLEFHDLDSIVTIGTARWHVKNKQIVGRIIRDTLNPDAQPIGDIPGRWMSPDPLSEETPSWSPYTMCMNNPVRFNDPSGMLAQSVIDDLWNKSGSGETKWTNNNGTFEGNNGATVQGETPPDDITVGADGKVSKVVTNDKPNRFFDQNGNQLSFNDPKSMDKHMFSRKFQKGDKVFETLWDLSERINSAGIINPLHFDSLRYTELAFKSYGSWDFPYALKGEFGVSDLEMNKAGYFGGTTSYFKFGTNSTLYNIYDAGQFIWGKASQMSGFNLSSILSGVNRYERFMGNQNGDSPADTRAIINGFNYNLSTQH